MRLLVLITTAALQFKLLVPRFNPFYKKACLHPSFCIVPVVKSQLLACLSMKADWLVGFSDDKRSAFVRSIGIGGESIRQTTLV
jgi:hypothetical protein